MTREEILAKVVTRIDKSPAVSMRQKDYTSPKIYSVDPQFRVKLFRGDLAEVEYKGVVIFDCKFDEIFAAIVRGEDRAEEQRQLKVADLLGEL